jgi:hypothetical protein
MPAPAVFLIQMPLASLEPNLAIAQLCGAVRSSGFDVEVMDISAALYDREREISGHIWAEETAGIWAEDDSVVLREVVQKNREWIERRYVERIAASERPVVGFSLTGCSRPASLMMARWIKEARPDALVVFGGQVFSAPLGAAEGIVAGDVVDAVVKGDGEGAFLDIVAARARGRSLENCAGIFVRDGAGRPRWTGRRAPLDLDDAPFADFSSFDMERYGSSRGVARVKSHDLIMMTNRGCVRRCAFCGHRMMWSGFRQMSGERIFAEIQHQRRAMPCFGMPESQIKFYDLLINGDMKKLGRLCDLLIMDSAARQPWLECNAVVRPEMTEDFCRKLYKAGCREIIIGLESGSQRVLDSMDKGQTVAQMKETLVNAHRAGLQVRGNFMFGYPGETEEDFERTLQFLKETHPYIHRIYPSCTLTHLEGRLGEDPEAWGVARGQDPYYWESKDGANNYPGRLARYGRFWLEALALGIGDKVISGTTMPLPALIAFNLATYHDKRGDQEEALRHYDAYLAIDPANPFIASRAAGMRARMREGCRA